MPLHTSCKSAVKDSILVASAICVWHLYTVHCNAQSLWLNSDAKLIILVEYERPYLETDIPARPDSWALFTTIRATPLERISAVIEIPRVQTFHSYAWIGSIPQPPGATGEFATHRFIGSPYLGCEWQFDSPSWSIEVGWRPDTVGKATGSSYLLEWSDPDRREAFRGDGGSITAMLNHRAVLFRAADIRLRAGIHRTQNISGWATPGQGKYALRYGLRINYCPGRLRIGLGTEGRENVFKRGIPISQIHETPLRHLTAQLGFDFDLIELGVRLSTFPHRRRYEYVDTLIVFYSVLSMFH